MVLVSILISIYWLWDLFHCIHRIVPSGKHFFFHSKGFRMTKIHSFYHIYSIWNLFCWNHTRGAHLCISIPVFIGFKNEARAIYCWNHYYYCFLTLMLNIYNSFHHMLFIVQVYRWFMCKSTNMVKQGWGNVYKTFISAPLSLLVSYLGWFGSVRV